MNRVEFSGRRAVKEAADPTATDAARLRSWLVVFGALVLAAALAGCAVPAAPSAEVSPGASTDATQPAGSVVTVEAGTPATIIRPEPITGRLSIRISDPGTGRSDGGTALFDLQGDDREGELRLSTVIGTFVAQARWDTRDAQLTVSQGSRRYPDLTALSEHLLGEPLPMSALLAWLRGKPWDGAPHEAQDSGFRQLGWDIGLQAWNEGLIVAQRSARSGGAEGRSAAAAQTEILVRARIERTP